VDKFTQNPKQRIQKIENAAIALKFVTQDLNIRLVSIGAEDIIDGDIKLILGLLWSSFRKLAMGNIDGRDESTGNKPEDDLLNWIREMTEGYEGVNIVNFKQSFNDGLAWAALINRFDNEYLDYDALDRGNPEGTLNKVFDTAEQKLGIPKLFNAKDLTDGSVPDERSMIIYSTLFYHAWKTDYSKRKENEKKRKKKNRTNST